ncbi:MAG: hypothetical protein GX557_10215 [Chloroflexi bacterium]|nr:hypothetical protein [Chloroflexota bacterium]
MGRYLIVGIVSGIVFGLLDGAINANSLGRRLNEVYQPIARPAINVPVGLVIDLAYGLALAGLFLLMHQCLPGSIGVVKGLCYALIVWFLRVAMGSVSHALMFRVPMQTTLYNLAAGLLEMLVLGVGYGLALRPTA